MSLIQLLLPMHEARAARDKGMAVATEHADEDTPGWSQAALDYLHNYALTHDRFPAWFVTGAAGLTGAVPQKSGKAWGSLFAKAQREGWIVKDGYTQDPNRHANPCPIYRSLIFREAA